jgi:hypothetical protein
MNLFNTTIRSCGFMTVTKFWPCYLESLSEIFFRIGANHHLLNRQEILFCSREIELFLTSFFTILTS